MHHRLYNGLGKKHCVLLWNDDCGLEFLPVCTEKKSILMRNSHLHFTGAFYSPDICITRLTLYCLLALMKKDDLWGWRSFINATTAIVILILIIIIVIIISIWDGYNRTRPQSHHHHCHHRPHHHHRHHHRCRHHHHHHSHHNFNLRWL